MKTPFLTLGLLISCFTAPLFAEEKAKLEPIFSGTDLSGWVVPEGNIWFSAKDGVLHVKNGPDKKGATLWTEKEYTDFVTEFDFKFIEGTVDSGIFMRRNHDQIQIGISGSLKRDMTGSPYIPKKGYPQEAEGVADLLKQDDWNSMRIKAVGPVYTVWLNGEKIITYTSDTSIETGPIGIQLHSNRDMKIDYRNFKAKEL